MVSAMLLAMGCALVAGCGGGSSPPDDPPEDDTVVAPSSPLVETGRLCGFLYRNAKTKQLSVQPMPLSTAGLAAVADAALRTDTGNLALTEPNGAFSFEGVPAGWRLVEVDSEGLFDDGAELQYKVRILAGRTSSGLRCPTDATGTVGAAMGYAYEDDAGALVLAPARRTDMRPVSLGTVEIGDRAVETDASGGYLATGLAPGARTVRTASAKGTAAVTIVAGLTAAGSDSRPATWGALDGYVGLAFDAGAPYLAVSDDRQDLEGIPRAQVVLDSGQRALTGAHGEYCLYGVVPKAHLLSASARGTGGLASVVPVLAGTVSHGFEAPVGSIATITVTAAPSGEPFSVGRAVALTAEATDPAGAVIDGFTAFHWFCSDTMRAQVDREGTVTALSAGAVTVGASAGGVSAGVGLEVLPAGTGVPARVALSLVGPTVLTVGTWRTLSARVYDETGALMPGHPVTLASSNTAVATVQPDGVVWAVGIGTATLSGAIAEGVVGSLPIEVVASNARLAVAPGSFAFGGSGQGTLSLSDRLLGFGGLMEWSVSCDRSWLSAVPLSGTGDGDVAVRVDATGLAEGVYTATVTVDAGTYGKREVPVTLSIQDVVVIIE